MNRTLAGCAIFAALCAAPAFAKVDPIGIKAPPTESTIAFDVNRAGQVAAILQDDEGRQRGVLFHKGVLTELGLKAGGYSDTKAINSRGQVVGSSQVESGGWQAYIYEKGAGTRELGTLGGRSSFGMDINEAGHATGFADLANGESHAFLFDGNRMIDLGTLGGKESYANGLNNKGQVVGTATLEDGSRRAFLYDAERGMVNLGTLGGRWSSATAINDRGQVVGASETADRKWHAFIHDGSKMIDLGAIIGPGSSFATGINADGHVVGTVLSGDERRSFIWRDGQVRIHSSGKGLYMTNAISDGGLVIGATMDKRLRAATMPSTAVVEEAKRASNKLVPLGLACLALAAAAVVWRRRYRGIDIGGYAA